MTILADLQGQTFSHEACGARTAARWGPPAVQNWPSPWREVRPRKGDSREELPLQGARPRLRAQPKAGSVRPEGADGWPRLLPNASPTGPVDDLTTGVGWR